MTKKQRKQAVEQLEEYAENSQYSNDIEYLVALRPIHIFNFIEKRRQLTDSVVLADTNAWGYGEAAKRIRAKAKELEIWT